jgi:hypothetical protein
MKPTSFKIRVWLGLALAAIVLGVPATAQADNVVPNPGFEQAGCDSGRVTSIGSASMALLFVCPEPIGCYPTSASELALSARRSARAHTRHPSGICLYPWVLSPRFTRPSSPTSFKSPTAPGRLQMISSAKFRAAASRGHC